MVLLIVLGACVTPLDIPAVSASDTIYIRGNGSVDPASAPIERRESNTYVFTDHITLPIVVERSNVLIDGAGYNLSGSGDGDGITAQARSSIIIFNLTIHGFNKGIRLSACTRCTITNTTVSTIVDDGILLADASAHNTIYGNTIINNLDDGINLVDGSHSNTVHGNTLARNSDSGIDLDHTAINNHIYHNNFIDNFDHVEGVIGSSNRWNASYPSGGNYWSDYTGEDDLSGPKQDVEGFDGIGDTRYEIDTDNYDHYPLMARYTDVTITYPQAPLTAITITCQPSSNEYCQGATVIISVTTSPILAGETITLRVTLYRTPSEVQSYHLPYLPSAVSSRRRRTGRRWRRRCSSCGTSGRTRC
jgi:parallel beta-helix repeat protein